MTESSGRDLFIVDNNVSGTNRLDITRERESEVAAGREARAAQPRIPAGQAGEGHADGIGAG